MYETNHDKFQTYFGREILQLHYIECDCLVLSNRTRKITNNVKYYEKFFDFSNLDKNQDLISRKRNKNVVGKLTLATPKKNCVD